MDRACVAARSCAMSSSSEKTNLLLKRVTGLGRLRVRGRGAVFTSIFLKIAGWNVLRASSVRALLAKLTKHGQGSENSESTLPLSWPYALIKGYERRHSNRFSTCRIKRRVQEDWGHPGETWGHPNSA